MQIKLLIDLDYFYQSCGIQNDFLMFTRMIDEVILAYIALSIDLWFIKWGPDTMGFFCFMGQFLSTMLSTLKDMPLQVRYTVQI